MISVVKLTAKMAAVLAQITAEPGETTEARYHTATLARLESAGMIRRGPSQPGTTFCLLYPTTEGLSVTSRSHRA